MNKILKIGIVGCGAIGSSLAKAIVARFSGKAQLTGLYDLEAKKSLDLAVRLKNKKLAAQDLNCLIRRCALVVEAARAKDACAIAEQALKQSRNVMVMSVGGIVRDYKKLKALAQKKRAKIYIPSGAICGIDGLKALAFSKIRSVTLTTKKPPRAFANVAYIQERKISLNSIKKDRVIFQGNALEATKFFPQNINVAAVLSLSGIGPERTRVKIIVSPGLTRNIHEIEMVSDAARITTRTENIAHPDNPKTSYLAVLSAISVLEQLTSSARIGN